MKVFNIRVEIMGVSGVRAKTIHQRANHLQGAIRQIYQDEPRLVRVVRILEEQ